MFRCMFKCVPIMHTFVHARTHLRMHAHVCACTHTFAHAHTFVDARTRLCMHAHVCVCTHIFAHALHMFAHARTPLCMCAHLCACTHTFAHAHTPLRIHAHLCTCTHTHTRLCATAVALNWTYCVSCPLQTHIKLLACSSFRPDRSIREPVRIVLVGCSKRWRTLHGALCKGSRGKWTYLCTAVSLSLLLGRGTVSFALVRFFLV